MTIYWKLVKLIDHEIQSYEIKNLDGIAYILFKLFSIDACNIYPNNVTY